MQYCKLHSDPTWPVAMAWLQTFLKEGQLTWPGDLSWPCFKNFPECRQWMSLKSQKVSARYLQPFGNGTRKTWGELLNPPPRMGLRVGAIRPPPETEPFRVRQELGLTPAPHEYLNACPTRVPFSRVTLRSVVMRQNIISTFSVYFICMLRSCLVYSLI